jgi:hypothetical protein
MWAPVQTGWDQGYQWGKASVESSLIRQRTVTVGPRGGWGWKGRHNQPHGRTVDLTSIIGVLAKQLNWTLDQILRVCTWIHQNKCSVATYLDVPSTSCRIKMCTIFLSQEVVSKELPCVWKNKPTLRHARLSVVNASDGEKRFLQCNGWILTDYLHLWWHEALTLTVLSLSFFVMFF